MHASDLEYWLKRRPFEPFEMLLTSGERIPVRHPDAVWTGRNAVLVIYARNRRLQGFAHISLFHIVKIEPANGRTRRRSKAATRR